MPPSAGAATFVGIENRSGSAYVVSMTGNSAPVTGGLGEDQLTSGACSDTGDFNTLSARGVAGIIWDVIEGVVPGQGGRSFQARCRRGPAAAQALSVPVAGRTFFAGSFARAGDLYFDNVAHLLYGSSDGDAAAEFAIQLVGVGTVAATDLIL